MIGTLGLGELYFVAVRSCMGKTALLLELALRIHQRYETNVVFATARELPEDILAKLNADLNDMSFDLIVSLSPEAHHTALEMTRTMAVDVEYWPTFDASLSVGQGNRHQTLDSYRRVRDQLFAKVKARFGLDGGPSV